MPRSPGNVTVAFNHAGLTHYGGSFYLHEFFRLLQLRHFLARHLHWDRRNSRYSLSQMILALTWPIILGLDRVESASLLRFNGTFQFLTGLQSIPDPRTLRRFLLAAPNSFAAGMARVNDRLLQFFTHLPDPRSRMISIWTAPWLLCSVISRALRSATILCPACHVFTPDPGITKTKSSFLCAVQRFLIRAQPCLECEGGRIANPLQDSILDSILPHQTAFAHRADS